MKKGKTPTKMRMHIKNAVALLCVFITFSLAAKAQIKRTRILFLIDASSSMTYNWQGSENRFQGAARCISAIMDSMYAVNNEVEFAVRIYGDQYGTEEKNCTDTRLVIPFNMQNSSQINQKLKYIKPLGSSPIAYSLSEASENELSNTENYDYSFILLTDGGESCNGNICDMYKKIVANKVKVSPYIIGLDKNDVLKPYYECLGQFVSVTNTNEIAEAARLIVKNNRPLLNKPTTLGLPTPKPNIPEPIAPPVVKKIDTPVNITPTEPIVDNLKFLPPILPLAKKIPAPSVAIVAKLKSKKAALLPSTIVVETPAKPDEMYAMLVDSKYEGLSTAHVIPRAKKWNTGKIKLPAAIVPEPTDAAFNLIALDAIEAKNIAAPKLQLPSKAKAITVAKVQLPKNIIAEKIDPAVDMQAMTAIAKSNTAKNIVTITKARSTAVSKPALPQEIVEPVYTPIALVAMPTKLRFPTQSYVVTNKVGTRHTTAPATLPKNIIVQEPDMVMEQMYPETFRFSSSPAKPYSRFAMRTFKQATLPATVVVKKKVPLPKPVVQDEKLEYKVETTPSDETKIVVYFTDGEGKFYSAKPFVALVDPNTKETVKKFYRDVVGGEPEPVRLDVSGVFDVTVLGQRDLVAENVTIEKNKINKVIIKVSKGTLIFSYNNNPSRPVEHTVKVRKILGKNAPPALVYSAMEQRLFEPGEYQIEVDILPNYILHSEISFGAITEIRLPQEGAMQIDASAASGPVVLYFQMGDTYEEFMTLPITGDLSKQRLVLRPGSYKASFIKPGSPKGSPPTIVSFTVKQNQETKFELKDYNELLVTPDGNGKPIYINETPKIEFIDGRPTLDGDGKEIKNKKVTVPGKR